MQLSPFVASVVGALTSAGFLEVFEVVPWRGLFGLAARSCIESQFSGQCITQEELELTLQNERLSAERESTTRADGPEFQCDPRPELQCRTCPPPPVCAECVPLEPVDTGLSGASVDFISVGAVFTWVSSFALGRWSTRREGGVRHPTMGLGRPPTRARPAALPEGTIVPSLARRSGSR